MHYLDILASIQDKAITCGRSMDEMTLIVVSKQQPLSDLQSIYQKGGRHFGESRMQDALEKIPQMPDDVIWHYIGSLQNKKVGKAIQTLDFIHSVDSLQLAQKISKTAQDVKKISILLQVNTSGEETKHGLTNNDWEKYLEELNDLPNLSIEGLMTMAPLTNDQTIIRSCFRTLYQLREKWKNSMRDPFSFRHLSMGMSNDYLIAIEEGATMLRIGRALF